MKKGRGRHQMKLVEVLKKDMTIKKITESMILISIEWWKRIHVVDFD